MSYVMEGYLKKLGGAMNTTWQTRYFTLDKEGKVSYYKTSNMTELKGHFDMRPPSTVVVMLRKDRQVMVLKPANNNNRKFTLVSDDPKIQEKWMEVFKMFTLNQSIKIDQTTTTTSTNLGQSLPMISDDESDSDEGIPMAKEATLMSSRHHNHHNNHRSESKKIEVRHTPLVSPTPASQRKSVAWFFSKEEQMQKMNEPIKEGVLFKKIEHQNEWISLYFKLLPVGILETYDNEHSRSANGTISLINAKIMTENIETYNKANVIAVTPVKTSLTSNSTWFICAKSPAEQRSWVTALCSCVSTKNTRDIGTLSPSKNTGNNKNNLLEGFLYRLLEEEENFVWYKYYFVVDQKQTLSYYNNIPKSIESTKCVDKMSLDQVQIQFITDDVYYRSGTFCVTDRRQNLWILSCDDYEDAQNWVNCILS